MDTIFLLLFFVSFIALIVGLVKPTAFSRFIKGEMTRKKIATVFGIATVASFVLFGITTDSSKNNNSEVTTQPATENENSLVANNEVVANLVEMFQESQKAMLEMKISGEGLSDDMKNTIVNNALEMRNQVVNSIDDFAQAQIKVLESLAESGVLAGEVFDQASAKTLEFAETEKVAAEERAERIREISELLNEENQSTIENKQALVDELNILNQQQFDSALRTASDQVTEILGLKELLKIESTRLAAESGAEIAQEAVKARDETIAAAEDKPAPTPSVTVSQKNALAKAKSYLNYTAFSHDGLVAQLEYDQFLHADAVYGADNSGANWNEQAAKKAKAYMEYSAFSRGSLIDQLKYDKFTQVQAEYGANAVGL